jgi:hypothetical protein
LAGSSLQQQSIQLDICCCYVCSNLQNVTFPTATCVEQQCCALSACRKLGRRLLPSLQEAACSSGAVTGAKGGSTLQHRYASVQAKLVSIMHVSHLLPARQAGKQAEKQLCQLAAFVRVGNFYVT